MGNNDFSLIKKELFKFYYLLGTTIKCWQIYFQPFSIYATYNYFIECLYYLYWDYPL